MTTTPKTLDPDVRIERFWSTRLDNGFRVDLDESGHFSVVIDEENDGYEYIIPIIDHHFLGVEPFDYLIQALTLIRDTALREGILTGDEEK